MFGISGMRLAAEYSSNRSAASIELIILPPLDFFLPLNILPANDVARLMLAIPFFGDPWIDAPDGHAITDPDRFPDCVRVRVSSKGPEPAKPGLLSGGVRTATESSDDISEDIETL